MLEQIIVTLSNLPNETIYFFLFAIAFTEYVFPPIPGDTIMVFGAYLVGVGRLDLFMKIGARKRKNNVGWCEKCPIGFPKPNGHFFVLCS